MSQVDWEDINSKLPFGREEEDVERRKKIWAEIDVNGNGFVSLSEVSTVCRRILQKNLKIWSDAIEGNPRRLETGGGV